MMGGLATDPDAFGAGIGLQFEVIVHVVLKLHSGPQLLSTIVTGKSLISLQMHIHCLFGHDQTYLVLAMQVF